MENIYLVFVFTSDTELLKPLEFPGNESYKSIFVMLMKYDDITFNELTFGKHPWIGWGWLPGEPTLWWKGWNFHVLLLGLG